MINNNLKVSNSLFKIPLSENRLFGLDLLRAFAILSVLYGHSRYLIKPYINAKVYEFFLFDGVSVFFVLSGFLIGRILIKEFNNTPFTLDVVKSFWVRRWWRTLPSYLFILTLLVAYNVFYLKGENLHIIRYYTFTQNVTYLVPNCFFPEAWSLSIEEWFYILIPICFYVSLKVSKQKKAVVLFWIFFIIITVTVYRNYLAYSLQCADVMCWVTNLRQLVVTRLDSMMYGVLGAYLYINKSSFFSYKRTTCILGVILMLLPQIYDFFIGGMFFKSYISLSIVPIATLLLLPQMIAIEVDKGVIYRTITQISIISYSLYLIHWSIVKTMLLPQINKIFIYWQWNDLTSSISNYILFWLLSFLLSILFCKYYELPMTRLRDYKYVR